MVSFYIYLSTLTHPLNALTRQHNNVHICMMTLCTIHPPITDSSVTQSQFYSYWSVRVWNKTDCHHLHFQFTNWTATPRGQRSAVHTWCTCSVYSINVCFHSTISMYNESTPLWERQCRYAYVDLKKITLQTETDTDIILQSVTMAL